MKKLLLALIALLVLTACGSSNKEVLHVYNWGAYMDPDTIKMFEDEYGVDVRVSYYDSNEAMYNKITNSVGYDILVPSDYMVQRLTEENLLQELDYSKIPSAETVIPALRGKHFDPENKFSVPYFWGNVGLVYNKDAVDLNDLETQGWGILNNPKYKESIYFYNSERDAFMIALKHLGYSMNSKDPKELEAANNWLIEMKNTTLPIYATDDAIDNMVNGIKDIAVMYSGDASYIVSENEEMAYYVPQEGSNIWLDSIVIPANAPNPDLAHKWIEFNLRHDIALMNTTEVGYTSPLQSVIDEITGAGGEYEGISSYIPRTDNPEDEEFYYDKDLKAIMNSYWEKIIAQ